jgi:hypothetical protein
LHATYVAQKEIQTPVHSKLTVSSTLYDINSTENYQLFAYPSFTHLLKIGSIYQTLLRLSTASSPPPPSAPRRATPSWSPSTTTSTSRTPADRLAVGRRHRRRHAVPNPPRRDLHLQIHRGQGEHMHTYLHRLSISHHDRWIELNN